MLRLYSIILLFGIFQGCESAIDVEILSEGKSSQAINPKNKISTGNFVSSSATNSSFEVELSYTDDLNGDASAIVYYCNETQSPGCNPLNGPGISLAKAGGKFSASLSDLNSEGEIGDYFKIEIEVSDADGVVGTELLSSIQLLTLDPYTDKTGLVAWYKFDEADINQITENYFADSSANGNDGFINSGDGSNKAVAGALKNSIYFDGSNDMASALDSLSLSIPGDKVSLSAWVNLAAMPASNWGRIISKSDGVTADDYALIINDSAQIIFRVNAGGVNQQVVGPIIEFNDWVHITGVYDGINSIIYLNGVEVGRRYFTGALAQTNNRLTLGGHYDASAGRYLQGKIDEVSIWSRALSGNEVRTIYDTQKLSLSPVTKIYRSVGPANVSVLAQGGTTNSLSISDGVATFTQDLPDNIGLGDVLSLDRNKDGVDDKVLFISARVDSKTYFLQESDGSKPVDYPNMDKAWNLKRAYVSLNNAVSGSENLIIETGIRDFDDVALGFRDLVTNNTQWNIVLYKDNVDTADINISGWSGNSRNYLRIYTPTKLSEVGVSQRHTGVAGTGYILNPTPLGQHALFIDSPYVRVEGIEVTDWLSGVAGALSVDGINIGKGGVHIDSVIVHDDGHGAENNSDAGGIQFGGSGLLYATVSNSIVYNIARFAYSNWDNTSGVLSVINSLAYNCMVNDNAGYGCFEARTGTNTIRSIHNISIATSDFAFDTEGGTYTEDSRGNISSDLTLPQPNSSQTGVGISDAAPFGPPKIYVTDLTPGFENFLLLIPEANPAVDAYATPINSLYKTDILGKKRSGSWDVGPFSIERP